MYWLHVRDAGGYDANLLTSEERSRIGRLRRPAERSLRTGAYLLLRMAVAEYSGVEPQSVKVERACDRCREQHGRPRLPGTGLNVSVTHSYQLAGVALSRVGHVGLDVERPDACRSAALSEHVLGAGERADGAAELCRYWTRKEAVVKATGHGLLVGLRDVLVTGPHEAASLLSYPGDGVLRARLVDLRATDDYLAAVAVVTRAAISVEERWFRGGSARPRA